MKMKKLVRDKIPKIIHQNGDSCTTIILGDVEYKKELKNKLLEETQEYLESENIEELADILEVIHAIIKTKGVSFDELENMRKNKKDKKGGFDNKIYIEKTEQKMSYPQFENNGVMKLDLTPKYRDIIVDSIYLEESELKQAPITHPKISQTMYIYKNIGFRFNDYDSDLSIVLLDEKLNVDEILFDANVWLISKDSYTYNYLQEYFKKLERLIDTDSKDSIKAYSEKIDEKFKATLKEDMLFIKVSEFAETPGSALRKDGAFSGEEFFNNILDPVFTYAIEIKSKVTIDLDGGYGYPVCFLKEAFGSLGKKYSADCVLDTLEFISTEEPSLITEIKKYIKN